MSTQPQSAPSRETGAADFSNRAHQQLIGYIGLLLPLLLIGLTRFRHTPGVPDEELLPSISAYYYTGAVAVFTGLLFALSLFLFTYRAYKDAVVDRFIGFVGGVAALCVAVFPTRNPFSEEQLSWWTDSIRTIHYCAALILFSVFALFAIWLFRKTGTPRGQALPKDKARRNVLFLTCGIAIVGCMVWAGIAGQAGDPIFWPEVGALCAFAVAWLTKGRAVRTATDAARRFPSRIRAMVPSRH